MHSVSGPITFGFIGLGVMGSGMAKNLRQKIPQESILYVCEIDKARLDQWIENCGSGNTRVAANPKEIAKNCDVIITMLPRGEHVLHVFTNKDDGLLAAKDGPGGKIFIECSTIDVKTSKLTASHVQESGLGQFADAPVSGGQGGAQAGTLTFMVGSSTDMFEIIAPILAHMGKPESINHCGDIGAGLATKLINNYMSAVNTIGVCEGMNLGRLYGLNPATLARVVNSSTGMSYNSREQNPVQGLSSIASSRNEFEGGFSTELCLGVLEMGQELSEQLGGITPLASTVLGLYKTAAQSEKCQGKDYRSIYRLFSEKDGEELVRQND